MRDVVGQQTTRISLEDCKLEGVIHLKLGFKASRCGFECSKLNLKDEAHFLTVATAQLGTND